MNTRIPRKIISGGQTGVDRAALDAALNAGMLVGGWCPRGRRAEDGPIDGCYPLAETPSSDYRQRTIWNVRDSDGTLVLRLNTAGPGTVLTEATARRLRKPLMLIDLTDPPEPEYIIRWIHAQQIFVLNVAGPRESECPGIYRAAKTLLSRLLREQYPA